MNWLLVSVCFVGFCYVALSDASEFPITDYIDTNRFMDTSHPYLTIINDIVNVHGSDDPEANVRILHELVEAVANMSPEGLKKFGLEGREKEELYGAETAAKYLIDFSELRCDRFTFEYFMKAIIQLFKGNLNEFVKEETVGETKMRNFLRHYGKKEITACLNEAIDPALLKYSEAETKMDKMVARDADIVGKQGYYKFLIDEAKELDLIKGKFRARAMLDQVDIYTERHSQTGQTAQQRLTRHLMESCHGIERQFGHKLDIYNLARLMIPSKVSEVSPTERFIKLNEYLRVCIPALHHENSKTIEKNIKCNMGFLRAGVSCFGL